MKRFIFLCCLFVSLNLWAATPRGQYIQPNNLYPKIEIQTNVGTMVFELDRSKAPITVDNFLSYVDAKRYVQTVFHRLEPDFVVQGGGYDETFHNIEEFDAIVNESGNGLSNDYGTISMARLYAPHSATSQFFINLADNSSLNPGRNWGYAVFGQIIAGEDVLAKINQMESDYSEQFGWPNVPKQPLFIKSVTVLPEAQ